MSPRRGAPSEESRITQRSYDRLAERFRERTRESRFSERWIERIAGRLAPGARIVDLGAGPGRHAASFRERGLRAVALDRSMGMHRAGEVEYPVPRVQADLLALPIADGRLDACFANASLLHLSPRELDAALCEIARASRPGALLYLSVKHGDATHAAWESERYGEPRWFQYWRGEDLDAAIGRRGFEIEGAEETRAAGWNWHRRLCRLRG